MKLQETLSKTYSIINRNIVVLSNTEKVVFPHNFKFNIQFSELAANIDKNYLGYNIYRVQSNQKEFFVCIQSNKYNLNQTTQLILYMIEASLTEASTSNKLLQSILDNRISKQEMLSFHEEFSNWLGCYLILVDYSYEQKEEINEIIMHSLDLQLILDYKGSFLVISNDENIEEACNNLAENILSDLFIECTVAIGGIIESIENLKSIYINCLQTLDLKKKYNLSNYVFNYEKMIIYRIISDMSTELKKDILNNVLDLKGSDIIDEEMEATIEAFFKNNLNFTDTAKNIFIHRNTLLYRIDKFQKHTGLDLKKFEDNWLLKLAWLIRQENNNEK
ncbi:PucR family transcriptional regulator [Brassicibacter mesophilus]|uniref:PucR family transcriptional regulator n=1 Tax=Brassicibacter mesophilus TaxID=745119 RepID=UPI003D190665